MLHIFNGGIVSVLSDGYNVGILIFLVILGAMVSLMNRAGGIIAPISSWAAAVASYVEDGQGLTVFIKSIPYNFYAWLTIIMMIGLAVMKVDYGPMARFEKNAQNGDLFSGKNPYAGMEEDVPEGKGRVLDLVLPIVVLVVCCVLGMLYSGNFFTGTSFVDALSGCDASQGLMLGSAFALVFAIVYYLCRRSMSFREIMNSIPEGFKAMVPAILILTFAWSLKAMTDSLGATAFVDTTLRASAESFKALLPAIVLMLGTLVVIKLINNRRPQNDT